MGRSGLMRVLTMPVPGDEHRRWAARRNLGAARRNLGAARRDGAGEVSLSE